MEVKLKEATEFRPLTLELKIESPVELLDLWSRCSIDHNTVNNKSELYSATQIGCMELFEALTQYKKQFNL